MSFHFVFRFSVALIVGICFGMVLKRENYTELENLLLSSEGINLINNGQTHSILIPRLIFQTWKSRSSIPITVDYNFAKYARYYERRIYTDSEVEDFFQKYFSAAVIEAKSKLKRSSHVADLFRYAILFLYGGVYFDIKSELTVPIDSMIKVNNTLFAALSYSRSQGIYQGFIASPPRNPIFLELIHHIVTIPKPIPDPIYHFSCNKFAELVNKVSGNVGKLLTSGKYTTINKNETGLPDIYLFEERSHDTIDCWDGPDRYNGCYMLHNEIGEIVLKVRYADFPYGAWSQKNLNQLTSRSPRTNGGRHLQPL